MKTWLYLPRPMPDALAGLVTLALDLSWTWDHGSDEIWRTLDADLWESMANPWLVLSIISEQRLEALAADSHFLKLVEERVALREERLAAGTWFSETYGSSFATRIAYFSMEFGLSESLPIYSGGLGILAGDYLKTASDLGVPVTGVGLLYQQGYFRQQLDSLGQQLEFYPYNDPTMLPVTPLRDEEGEWVSVELAFPGRLLRLRTWVAQVGRCTLFLLDSNDPRNDPGDRGITSELYGGGEEMRLQQELVLGIGGWRLLDMLGIDCGICHLNEGHAAFALLERARTYMQRHQVDFPTALRTTRAGNLFTTHTPVAAGFDRFRPELLDLYLEAYLAKLGITLFDLMAMGRSDPGDGNEPLNMAWLAIRGSGAVNGVSRLHGDVSRQIFQPLFPRWPREEVPVGHVTNGVHTPSWDSWVSDTLWTDACGRARWRGSLENVEEDLRKISDEGLWDMRAAQRKDLMDYLRRHLVRLHCERGIGREWGKHCGLMLDQDILTLGFARRFTGYKRTNLLLRDPERLLALINNRDRPVQLVLSGKAHPQDKEGKAMLRQWHEFIARPEVNGHVVFVQDYDMTVASKLVQGVDVWINTPRRPWEACGTSGMKVLVNGGLNLSELDGWWAEAYRPEVGWALGDMAEHHDQAEWDAREAERLYELLEQEVVPLFYNRDEQGLSRGWIARMRESMAHLTPRYSSNRMLREYMDTYYIPLFRSLELRTETVAGELNRWQDKLRSHWHRVHFGNVTWSASDGQHHFIVQAYLDGLEPDDVSIELYAEADAQKSRHVITMTRGDILAGAVSGYSYHATVPADRSPEDYTARIIPSHPQAKIPLEAPMIIWQR